MDELTRKIHLHLRNQNGMSLGALKRQFPNVNDLDTIIVNSPELFWIANRDTRNKEIRAKIDIKLCCSYLLSTCNGFCGCLHVCKDFILCRQFCPDPCKKGLSHIIMNSHNILLLSSYKCSGLELLLRSSFPRLCKSYQDNGICRQTFCGYLHLCREFVLGTCLGKCKLATLNWRLATELHNIESYHNKKVLFMFNMDPTKLDHKVIFCNILSANDSSLGKEANVKKVPLDESKPNKTENDRLLLCAHYLNGNCQNKNCSRLHMCKEFLVDDSKCNPEICKFGFSHSPLDVHNRNVLLRNGIYLQNRGELLKHLRDSFPRVCSYHQDGFGCSHAKCDRLHMCLKFCIGRCNNMKCALSHNFTDRHNLEILQHFFLHKDESMGKEFILTNVLFSKVSLTNSKTQDGKYASAGNTGERNSIYQSTPDLFKRSPLMNDANELRRSELPHKKQSIKLKVQTSGEKEVLSTKISPEKEANVEKVPQAESKPSKEFNSPLSLCSHYLNGNCQDRNCLGLHMCKEFLVDDSKCNPEICKFGFSHSPLDVHNRNVLLRNGIYLRNRGEILKHLRDSFPRVCSYHQDGFGCSHAKCDRLHMCLKFCIGRCNNMQCALSHNFTDRHNLEILQHFFLHKDESMGKEYILTNVLFSKVSLTNSKTQDGKYASAGNTGERNSIYQSTPDLFKRSPLMNDANELRRSELPDKNQSIKLKVQTSGEKEVLSTKISPEKEANVEKVSQAESKPSKEFNSPLSICSHYLNGNCQDRNCLGLHMCKEFLDDGSKCNQEICKFGLSHSPLDAHNKNVLLKSGIHDNNGTELLKHLRCLFPRVCTSHQHGFGCSHAQCDRLHICLEFCIGRCNNLKCALSHNLKSKHNLNVLQHFFLHETWIQGEYTEKEFILRNVLFSQCITNAKTQDVKYASAGNIAKRNPVCLSTSRLPKSVGLQNDLIEKCASDLPERKESIALEEEECIESEDETLSEKDVFYHILKNKSDGFCSVTDIINFLNLDSEESALAWLQHHKHTFRIVTNLRNEKIVYLCLAEVRPCNKYWQMDVGCTNANCQMFHLCQAYLTGTSHNTRTCKLNHNLKDLREKKLMQQLEWSVNEDQLSLLLKMRYPYVCSYYAKENCEYGEELCPNLHVCIDFMKGNCKKQGLCRFKHESAVSGKQANRLMKEYQLDDDDFGTCVIIPDSSEKDIKSDATSLDLFDWLKEEGVCRSFLVDKCSSEADCHLVHPPTKSPYLWQYKKACNNEVWNNFPQDINSSIEENYCDPSASQFINGELHIIFSSGISTYGTYDGYDVTVRRLSTMSVVQTAPEEAFISTEWKWYWQMNVEKWEQYHFNVKCDPFEKAYLKGDQHFVFTTNQFKYKLSFQEMTQENQDERYKTKRNVRRRPVFKEAELIRKKLALSALYRTPLHWPVTFTPGQRIPLQDAAIYKKLIDSFRSTMPSFQVITIDEICHSAHFAQFQIKKDEFSKRLTDVNEMTLYHGTSHMVINHICVQNFDWRLCGKNATQFGQGSYFSNNARYSHRYSTSDAEGIFYMFVAEVLVGQYAKGDSSMKRPPNLPNSDVELYDSCVNDVKNPIIFVIYERDQCYPRYLLSYRQKPLDVLFLPERI